MAKLIHIVSLVLLISLWSYSSAKKGKKRQMLPVSNLDKAAPVKPDKPVTVDASAAENAAEPLNNLAKAAEAVPGNEGKAGKAIKALLQEKINQKFKEAAIEVKGVLVKQLGDSLKSAHDSFKITTGVKHHKKKPQENKGAALIHQNKGNRTRKESGPLLKGPPKPVLPPPKPLEEAKGGNSPAQEAKVFDAKMAKEGMTDKDLNVSPPITTTPPRPPCPSCSPPCPSCTPPCPSCTPPCETCVMTPTQPPPMQPRPAADMTIG